MRFVLLTLLLASSTAAAQSTARYTVTFESTWSASTHPDDFPGASAHYSGLVGATHDASTHVWSRDELASAGVQRMAETGGKSLLLDEVEALVQAGTAGTALSGGAIAQSPGMVSLTFDVTESHSFVSLVSMIAPSPDWFVGVDGLALRLFGDWVLKSEAALYVYDAGTDSGASYTSPDAATTPAEAIARIEESPFKVGDAVVPVGTFTFTLQSVTSSTLSPKAFAITGPAPNPTSREASFRLGGPRTEAIAVAVVDALGRRTASHQLAPGRRQLDLDTSSWAPGVYAVVFESREGRAVRQLVVHR